MLPRREIIFISGVDMVLLVYYIRYTSCHSSVVERVLGKDEVGSSILPDSTSGKCESGFRLRCNSPYVEACLGRQKCFLKSFRRIPKADFTPSIRYGVALSDCV